MTALNKLMQTGHPEEEDDQRTRLDSIKSYHREQRELARVKHEEEMDKFRENCVEEVQQLTVKHSEEMEKLQKQFDNVMTLS